MKVLSTAAIALACSITPGAGVRIVKKRNKDPQADALAAAAMPEVRSADACQAQWDQDADGTTCGGRVEWLMDNNGVNLERAKHQVADEFPATCGACTQSCQRGSDASGHSCGDRITWLMNNERLSEDEAGKRVATEFPNICWACAPSCAGQWERDAGGYTCGSRISWLVENGRCGRDACRNQVANEFPADCGACGKVDTTPRCEQWNNQACEGQFGYEDCRTCGTRILQLQGRGLSYEVAAQRIADKFLGACGGCGSKSGDTELQYEGYQQVWSDEFDGAGKVDGGLWRSVVRGDGFGNNELQYYTDRLDNAWLSNGTLKIKAKLEDFGGRRFTSAKLESTSSWKYGKFHCRSRLIGTATGTWAAHWMMPEVSHYGIWPHSGEIDIMEHVGYDTGKFHGTVHTGAYHHSIGTQIGGSTDVAAHDWHTWTVEWRPDIILFAVNDQVYQIFRNEGDGDTEKWPFDQKFYVILNHAVGGNWGGQRGIDEASFATKDGQTFEVDWVRVEQRPEGWAPPATA